MHAQGIMDRLGMERLTLTHEDAQSLDGKQTTNVSEDQRH